MQLFTPQERFTILFLVLLFVLGGSLYLYKLNHPSFAPAYTIEGFDRILDPSRPSSEPVDYNLPLPADDDRKTTMIASRPKKQVNINAASISELMTLPGIGPVYARRIIEYREKNGVFGTTADIKSIKGIGEKTYLKMKPYLTVE